MLERRESMRNFMHGSFMLGKYKEAIALVRRPILQRVNVRQAGRLVIQLLMASYTALAISYAASAQTVRVDITPGHEVNSIVPNQALGAGIDRLPKGVTDKLLAEPILSKILSAGWQPVTYRQNTELFVEAWHWNPQGTWSDPSGKGYFTGNSTPTEFIRHSYGYLLPHRGFTRNDGTENNGYSRLTDGDENSYWKSNPYLTRAYTGEDDSLHPQWVILDFANVEMVDSIRIAWGDPYAKRYLVQYWTGDDPIKAQTKGVWHTFPEGEITSGRGGDATIRLAAFPIPVRFIRIWMTESSGTPDSHGPSDPRNSMGYAIREIYAGTLTGDGELHDVIRHQPDQVQTTTYCSSVDPWHEPSDLDPQMRDQVGFDLFYTSGVTRGLPAMIPIALLYGTPEDSAAQIAYIEKRGYPISYVEMGEEADGQYMLPEDYAALYVQWAAAIHKVDPRVKLGGPVFQGVNQDIEVWPDEQGRVSWLGRFFDYLKSHGRISDLAFLSFEHYPLEPCKLSWSTLYEEPTLVSHILQVW
ncbi:MAG TPA: discoidin domain-containing protein, partial [Blastocatellia bacterium]